MASKKRLFKRQLKKLFRPSIGKLICILTLAYFVFTFYSYSTRTTVSYYEVEEGSLVKEHNYQGLILRNERIVNSEANGYIYFFVADGRKAAKGSPVYSIDEGGRLMDYINAHADTLIQLNSAKIADIRAEILDDSRNFSPDNFRSLYNIKNTLDAHITEYASMNIFSSLQDELKASGIDYKQFNSDSTGIVCTYTDGFESMTEDEVDADLFNTENYVKQTVKAGDLVTSGSPAYKLITDEAWKIIFPVDDEDTAEFAEGDTVKLSFADKGFTVKSKLRFIGGTDGKRYGVIDLDSYVIQFTSDRFVNFEIVTNDVSGLKIPDKAVTTKDFYCIPASYVITDDKGNKGFNKAVISDSGTAAQFVMPDIYSIDDEYAYIDCDDKDCPLKPGDYVMAGNASAAAIPPGTAPVYETAAEDNDTAAGADTGAAGDEDISDAVQASDASEATADTAAESGNSSDSDSTSDSGNTSTNGGNTHDESLSEDKSSESSSAAEMPEAGESLNTAEDSEGGHEGLDVSDSEVNGSGSSGPSGYDTGVKAQPSGLYQINSKRPLKGAYNVNKGYTVFKKVEILESANGYSIIKKNSSYGLQVYDHIVLDASGVHDGQLLYR